MSASNTETKCQACGGLVDHRSRIIKHTGQASMRECIHCGHAQRCRENITSDQNRSIMGFLDKLTASPNVELNDAHKAKWLRDLVTTRGYVPQGQLRDLRGLQKKYDTQV